ncbi:carboxylesterase/lipase family protein [Streptomyces sp. Je 1-369]|uniref:carboxylesterase/lipase family protein n=1 Tax=Streptomyces sp. Je 1-369 TaxID=2966192 RepID=UPI0022858F87|nr:carboxylesterase family protein [Streptomyces sp. Je 1-369]WAL97956.1 carboxylesterase family protein [Streptomyces sp. Je 1-369]
MAADADRPHPTVMTAHGPVRGERRATGTRFLGIPYAAPPVGDLRFAAPVLPDPWTAPLDATAYGPTAQRRGFGDGATIPEPSVPGAGILNLNVFTPGPDPEAALPVLFWIHGGGYVAGSAASPWYDGTAFNRDGVVLVSVGYRLGIEGFLHLRDAPDNRGVRDWIAALEWVRDNIAGFGGDPAKVTVAGQSAGGGAVQTLLATPAARGLFRAAISMSGSLIEPQERRVGPAVAELFTGRTGLPATAAALRDLSDGRLLELQDALSAPGPDRDRLPGPLLGPVADGRLVPRPVRTELTDGDLAADVPLLIGYTRHEFDEFGGQELTDLVFRRPALAVARARAARGHPTWLYEFVWPSPVPGARHGLAFHCLDLPFAFDLLHAEGVTAAAGAAPPQALADAMHGAWTAFVRDLDPGADSFPGGFHWSS